MSKKKTKRCSSLCRSQNAHDRLWRKYSSMNGRASQIKADYHESVYMAQHRNKRVLSLKEKRYIFEALKQNF